MAVGAYGLSFGAAAVTAGLSTLQACVLSLLLFTGASQFALVGVLGAGGSAVAAVASALLLGTRNALYAVRLASLVPVRGARRLVAAQVNHHAGREEVLELELVNRARRAPFGGGVVVPWRVDVRAGVGRERQALRADPHPAHVLRLGAEHELALRQGLGVALILDLRSEDRAHAALDLAGVRRLYGHAEIDESQAH